MPLNDARSKRHGMVMMNVMFVQLREDASRHAHRHDVMSMRAVGVLVG